MSKQFKAPDGQAIMGGQLVSLSAMPNQSSVRNTLRNWRTQTEEKKPKAPQSSRFTNPSSLSDAMRHSLGKR